MNRIKYEIIAELCMMCGLCEAVCRLGAVVREENFYRIRREKCAGCGVCRKECPVSCIGTAFNGRL